MRQGQRRSLRTTLVTVCLIFAGPLLASSASLDDLIEKYEALLLIQSSDYEGGEAAKAAFEDQLLQRFRRAVRFAGSFAFERRGELAYFAKTADTETAEPAQEPTSGESNGAFHRLFNEISLTLAYAYHTPGTADTANPYYQNSNVLQLYLSVLDYAYSRGLTENAWLPDHAGNASVEALEQGLVRTSGDFSEVSLRLAGYIQSVFLMRNELAGANLLAKYRAVVRNLVVNCGVMYGAFFQTAREEAGVSYADPLPIERQYLLNADGMRLFVDYFWPYYLLVDDVDERSMMAVILYRVIDTNIATRPGVYGTIKPDGTGFHHGAAYVGAYSPFALEAFAQLLYLSKGTTFYRTENIDAVKLALDAYRVMVQKYSVTAALRGRLIRGSGDGVSNAVSKAMAFLAHPDGLDDFDMKARFAEFFDEEHFFSDERQRPYFEGSRGLAIRGLGIYRLVSALQASSIEPSDPPSGTWIKPYAAAGFFRRGDWLVAAKGFSQYFWDYEGNLDGGENSFGQNWAYGSLMVFSAGAPISERGSGYALFDGWDWYHVPGTTASHYTIEERDEDDLRATRRELGIERRTTHRNYNSKTFVGGVSLGDHGLFVQDLEAVPFTAPTDLRGWKSYFFVGDQVLAIGSHISGGTEEEETHTTLFQTYLEDTAVATQVNAQQLTGVDQLVEHEAGTSVKMTDSVGNSFFLQSSTAKLVVSRKLQQSMSDDYESTEGAFASAYLDHGIKPEQDSYRYVLIPADTDGSKLEQVAADTAAYYEVLDDTNMHLVRFPPQDITAYAFFKPVETPEDELIRTVNQPAAVMIHEQEEEAESDGEVEGEQEEQGEETSVRLVASVPDIGWQFESDIFSRGLSYASSHFAMQRAKEHKLWLVLRGEWCPDELTAPSGSEWISLFGHTLLQLQCKDGLGTEILLRSCAATSDDSETDAEGSSGTSSADSNPEDAPETVAPSPVDGSVSMAPIASSE
ncbi:MAG: chondroitinase family polysaccharide lyase [Bryobacterales bacterium]|nr:chondroitinase family polysaccharide lyase [Bryobacterales bacterium]